MGLLKVRGYELLFATDSLLIVQVGSLGLPGTQWAKGEVLDANTQARGLNNLLWNLLERGELCLDPPLCVVIMGLGSGANAVLHFAGTFLTKAKFTPLRAATRFLSIVNPFPSAPSLTVDTVDTRTKKMFNSLKSLRRVLERGAHHEQLQSLTKALFSPEFIQEVSVYTLKHRKLVHLHTTALRTLVLSYASFSPTCNR